MGKANRARRAAKQRRREQKARLRGRWSAPGADPRFTDLDALLVAAVDAVIIGDRAVLAEAVARLMAPGGPAPAAVAVGLAGLAERVTAALWDRGWQPADLARQARRHLSGPAGSFVLAAMGAESRAYAAVGAAVAPWWMDQLAELGAVVPAEGDAIGSWPLAWAAQQRLSWGEALGEAFAAIALLAVLPPITELAPPPRTWRADGRPRGPEPGRAASRSHVDAKVLARVRALLAKAESTEFEEEAAAFTAKAQELITRHRIDRLLLDDDAGGTAFVCARRIGVDDPYAGPKAVLLDAVADANGCRAVWSKALGFATVFGEPADLETVELLFTSLLVQATTAMQTAGAGARAGSRPRSRAFRQSFLLGYAGRIRTRLQGGVAAATAAAAAEVGDRFLPVLAGRKQEVDDAVRAAFGHLAEGSFRVHDMGGYAAGAAAADLADLTTGHDALAAG